MQLTSDFYSGLDGGFSKQILERKCWVINARRSWKIVRWLEQFKLKRKNNENVDLYFKFKTIKLKNLKIILSLHKTDGEKLCVGFFPSSSLCFPLWYRLTYSVDF